MQSRPPRVEPQDGAFLSSEITVKQVFFSAWTPLMVACGRGHEHIVRRLSQVTGIQLNTRDDRGYTALHLAVDCDNPATVSVLRGLAGVDWNVRDNRGSYPLTDAVGRAFPC